MRQDPQNISLTGITDYKAFSQHVKILTVEAKLKIVIYSHEIIQIHAVRNDQEFEDFSYAVVMEPQPIDWSQEEQEDKYLIQTDKINLFVYKNPLRIRFLDKKGNLLNEDDPGLGIAWIGDEVTNYKKLQEGERFLGLGEKTGNLDRRGRVYVNWNTDQFGYGPDTDPLYASIPFYVGLHQPSAYGIFLDNTYHTKFNFGASNDRFSFFQASMGGLRYYFIHDESLTKIVEAYTALTGRMKMPPLWSLGFQQCRYSYYPDQEVLNVAENFRKRDIPADVIYLDIHYMERYKVFTWHQERFPDPAGFVKQLKEQGFHVIPMVDPGIKIEEGYDCYEEGKDKDLFVKYPDGGLYTGAVWPGWCHFPDFTKPETRAWWGDYYQSLVEMGIEGFWNDMNEPAVWDKNFPDLVEFDYDGLGATHKKAHNIYGLQMIRATHEGVSKLSPNRRAFILTRSGFAGLQRYAAIWTGDNVSYEEHMFSDVRLINSLGLSGVAFAGCDVGGFVGEASIDLFCRWVAWGAFSPFFRCHTMINSRDAEPWTFGEEAEEIARNFIKLRYRLLPYFYSLFREASQTGAPISRTLALDYTWDDLVYHPTYQNQFLCGPNLLICPLDSRQNYHKIYLPAGEWYHLFVDQKYTGSQEMFVECAKDEIPAFVRAGGMLLMQSPISHTGEKPEKTLEIHLYQGDTGSNFTYYEDDGETLAYEQQAYYQRILRYEPAQSQLLIEAKTGQMGSHFEKAKIYLHGFDPDTLKPKSGGLDLDIHQMDYRFVEPISNFDPYEDSEDLSKVVSGLAYVEIDWSEDEIVVSLD